MYPQFFDKSLNKKTDIISLSVRLFQDLIKTIDDILSVINYFIPNLALNLIINFLDLFINNNHLTSLKP
jgi:hypothetical protein